MFIASPVTSSSIFFSHRTNYRLIVENLSSSVSWQDLKDYMRKSGEVNYADAHKNRQNEGIIEFTSRFVRFDMLSHIYVYRLFNGLMMAWIIFVTVFFTREGMERALDELDGTELNGRKIRLIEENKRSRSRSRSGSRRRSRWLPCNARSICTYRVMTSEIVC